MNQVHHVAVPVFKVDDGPTSFDALEIRRLLGRGNWSTPQRHGPDGWSFVALDGSGSVIVSCAPAGEHGDDWVHASLAWDDHVPTYSDLRWLHAAVFGAGWAYQVFAPPGEHVNIHEYALHLWGRLDGKPGLPNFAEGRGSI
jgi:hypothetical protein